MGVQIIGPSGNILEMDSKRNQRIRGIQPAAFVSGGAYSVAGWSTGVVAAAFAASGSLVALRFSTGAAAGKNAYITRIRFQMSPVLVGASGGIPGVFAWQLFDTAAFSGGNSRSSSIFRKNSGVGSISEMADIRDFNAALTTGSIAMLEPILSAAHIPNTTGQLIYEWFADLDGFHGQPAQLTAGQGLTLRAKIVMPATMTWMFNYVADWYESTD